MPTGDHEAEIDGAAAAIAAADALVIGAGAGLGVDSGLPDFRGVQGFWNAYPAYAQLGLNFVELANPRWFATDPALAWGFYGHRLGLYRAARPHDGFAIVKRWAARMPRGAFVVTSNIDGQFQRAGFSEESVVEVHGSIHWMQCTDRCAGGLFPADPFAVEVDEATFRAVGALPACPNCGALARPNVLMFGDGGWDDARTAEQWERIGPWLRDLESARVVVIELGAGSAVPTVRLFSEATARGRDRKLIRINPREPSAPRGHLSVPLGALDALQRIDARLSVG